MFCKDAITLFPHLGFCQIEICCSLVTANVLCFFRPLGNRLILCKHYTDSFTSIILLFIHAQNNLLFGKWEMPSIFNGAISGLHNCKLELNRANEEHSGCAALMLSAHNILEKITPLSLGMKKKLKIKGRQSNGGMRHSQDHFGRFSPALRRHTGSYLP